MARSRSAAGTLAFIGVLTLLVGVYAWAWDGHPEMEGDSQDYLDVAVDLHDGSLDRLSSRPVGYPLLLVATGSTEKPSLKLLVTQLSLHAAAVALLVALLRRVGAGRAAIVVFAAVAMLPPFVEHADFILSESLTQFCVVSGFVAFVSWLLGGRALWLAASAAALGLVPVVHMAGGLLWLVLPGCAGLACILAPAGSPFRRRTAGGAAALGAAAALVIGSVVAWNVARFDYVGLSPALGTRLSHKTIRVLELLPDEYADVREILIRHRDAALLDPASQHLGLAYISRALPELQAKRGLEGPALSDYLVRMNLALIKRSPMDYVDEVLRSAIWFWVPGVTDRSAFGSGAVKASFNGVRSLVLGAFGVTFLLLAGPIVLLIRMLGRRAEPLDITTSDLWAPLLVMWLALGAIVSCCLVSITLTAAVYRLRIPVDLLILACVVLLPTVWPRLLKSLGL